MEKLLDKYSNDSMEFGDENENNGTKKYWPYAVGCLVLLFVIGTFTYNCFGRNESRSDIVADSMIVEYQSDEVELKSGKDYTEKDIETAIIKMYEEILGKEDHLLLEPKYVSKGLIDLYARAEAVSEGDAFIYSDHWVDAQDYNQPSLQGVSVKRLSDNEVIAKVRIKPFKEYDVEKRMKLFVVYEDGRWVVDDFISESDGNEWSEKTWLENYIKETPSILEEEKRSLRDSI